jgi:polar amino acid transport system substrate-binding protein
MLLITRVIYLTFFIFSSTISAETVFRAAYENASQYPYYVGDTSKVFNEKPGAAVELVKLLEQKIPDFKVEFIRRPWKQCLLMLNEGQVDGIFNASFNTQRLAIGTYPWKNNSVDSNRRITTINYHFYRLKGSMFHWDGDTVSGLIPKVGTTLGYSIEGDLERMGIEILSARNIQLNFSNLFRGKVNALALQDITGDFHIKRKAGLKSIEKVLPALYTKTYYLVLSKQFNNKYPELSEIIWNKLALLREEKMSELVQTYY